MHLVIFCGSRDWRDARPIQRTLSALIERHGSGLEVIIGECRGADMIARSCCFALGLEPRLFEADWRALGNAAGPIRNGGMIDTIAVADSCAVYAYKDRFDWTLITGRNGGHSEGTCVLALESLIFPHVYSGGKWRTLTLLDHRLTLDTVARAVSTTAGRERARRILRDGKGISFLNREMLFEALTDAETANGENP